MKIRPALTAGSLVTIGWLAVGPVAPALAVCDAYSGACPSAAPTEAPREVEGTTTGPATTTPVKTTPVKTTPVKTTPVKTAPVRNAPARGGSSSPATLPFTGGEIVLLSTLGLGALAGGTALVLAGRRRTAPAEPTA